jgi:formylglycine-generating enzyme
MPRRSVDALPPLRALSAGLFVVFVSVSARAGDDDLSLDLGGPSLELRRIPKGSFHQGSPPNEVGREADETPRNVAITHSFWIGKVPVTRAQFAHFVSDTHFVTEAEKGQSGGYGWDGKALAQRKEYTWQNPGFPQKDEDPVVLVSFADANAFTVWASRKTGRHTRLPTEAEWEYSARAGTTTPWFDATTEDEALALGWFKPNSPGSTHPVGTKAANAFGLFDMAGNVYEWCRDVDAPYGTADVTDPENLAAPAGEPERRVLRGGSWLKEPRRGRSAARYRNTPGSRNADNGFRLVVDDDGASSAPSAAGLSAPDPSARIDESVPTVGPPKASSDGMAWSLLAAPAAAAGAVTAWLLLRRKRGTPAGAGGVTVRAGIDGFWIRAASLPIGTRVRYTCIVDQIDVADIVPLDGAAETFVFTGGAPTAIQITEVIEARPENYRGAAPWDGSVRDMAAAAASMNEIPRAPPSFSSVPSLELPRTPVPAPSSRPLPPPVPSRASTPSPPGVTERKETLFLGYPSAY